MYIFIYTCEGMCGSVDEKSPWNEVIGGYEMYNVSGRKQTQVLLRKKTALKDLKHSVVFITEWNMHSDGNSPSTFISYNTVIT